jgi:hypothetical protein
MTSTLFANAKDATTTVSAPRTGASSTLLTALLCIQGLYDLLTGIWPLVSIETFQMVTGPKTDHLATGREADHWLVMTVGVLVTCIALTLLNAARRRRSSPEIVTLAVTSALALTGLDVIYVARQIIAPIYLADAALEILFLATWAFLLVRRLPTRKAGDV